MDLDAFRLAKGDSFWLSPSLAVPLDHSLQSRALRPLRGLLKMVDVRAYTGVSLTGRWGWPPVEPTERHTDLWTRSFGPGVSPSEVARILTNTHTMPTAVLVHLQQPRPTAAAEAIYLLAIHNEGTPIAFGRRVVCARDHSAYHDYLYVMQSAQGAGTATRVLHNAVMLYDKMGVTKVRIVAGLSAGSVVWPRMGFRPTPEGWESLRRRFRTLLREERLPDAITRHPLGIALLNSALKSSDPRALWLIADAPKNMGAGLLQGARWSGILDLGDPLARARLNAYVGRKLGV